MYLYIDLHAEIQGRKAEKKVYNKYVPMLKIT